MRRTRKIRGKSKRKDKFVGLALVLLLIGATAVFIWVRHDPAEEPAGATDSKLSERQSGHETATDIGDSSVGEPDMTESRSQDEYIAEPDQENEEGLEYSTTWFGMSWPGGPKWMQTSIGYLMVTDDGMVVTHSPWDEAHRNATLYSEDGDIIAGVPSGTSRVITADDKYVYVPYKKKNEQGKELMGVARYYRNHLHRKFKGYKEELRTLPAPIDGPGPERGLKLLNGARWRYDKGFGNLPNYNVWLERPEYLWSDWKREKQLEKDPSLAEMYRRPPPQLRGMVSDGVTLFVADDINQQITLLDVETMEKRDSFEVPYPGPVTLDENGNLWIIQRPDAEELEGRAGWLDRGPHRVVEYTKDGVATGRRITDLKRPSAIDCGGPDGLLYVADAHPERFQVFVYDVSGSEPELVDKIGEEGGIFAGPVRGRRGPHRLDMLSGVGVDAQGRVTVSTRGASGSFIRQFDADRSVRWERYTATFMDGASFDPAYDGTVVYSGQGSANKFVLNYDRTERLDEWVAVTRDNSQYPHDSRNYRGEVIRLPNGRLYLQTDGGGSGTGRGTLILRKEKGGEIFVPSVYLSNGHHSEGGYPPERPMDGDIPARMMWRDVDGDGKMTPDEYFDIEGHENNRKWRLDSHGNLWEDFSAGFKNRDGRGILRYELKGFDEHENPIYDFDLQNAELIENPAPFAGRGRHKSRTVIEDFHYDADHDRMYISGYTADYEGSLTGKVGPEFVVYENFMDEERREILSVIDMGRDISSWDVAGGLLFAAQGTDKEGDESVHVFNIRTGESLGWMTPGPRLYAEKSWLDIPWAIAAFKRSNGEIIVTQENNWKNLKIVYRLPPQDMLPKGKYSGLEEKRLTPAISEDLKEATSFGL